MITIVVVVATIVLVILPYLSASYIGQPPIMAQPQLPQPSHVTSTSTCKSFYFTLINQPTCNMNSFKRYLFYFINNKGSCMMHQEIKQEI